MNDLNKFKDDLARDMFGITKDEAQQLGVCIRCKQPITPKNIYSPAGHREYVISGLCELCFDFITNIEDYD